MGRKYEWNARRVINEIKKKSKDGIAPPTSKYQYLRVAALRYWESWEKACELANVKTRKQARYFLKPKSEKIRILAMTLHLASIKGEIDSEIIHKCMDLVRKGLVDEYYYQVKEGRCVIDETRRVV